MPININTDSFNSSRIFDKKDLNGLDHTWVKKKPTSMTSSGTKTYDVFEKVINQNQHGKFIRAVAFSLTFLSFGFALISSTIRNIWKEAIAGTQVKTINVYSDQPNTLPNQLTPSSMTETPSVETVFSNIRVNEIIEKTQDGSVTTEKTDANIAQNLMPKNTVQKIPQVTVKRDAAPKKEALPKLLNLSLEEGHPLNTPLSMEIFQSPSLSVQIFTTETYNEFDSDLYNLPLFGWIDKVNQLANLKMPTEYTPSSQIISRSQRYLNYKSLIEENSLLHQRMKALEESIQLKERLSRLDNPSYVQLQHLVPKWNDNPCRFFLMMDDELSKLKLSDIPKTMTANPGFILRIKELCKQQARPSKSLELENSLLIDAAQITAIQVNANHKNLPNIVLSLLSEKEVSEIDTATLLDDEVNALFSLEDQVKNLTKKQIDACFEKINIDFFSFFSEKQILDLDPSKIDSKCFSVIFKLPNKKITDCLQKLPLKTIYILSPYFLKEHWDALNNNQVSEFDFSKFKPSNGSKITHQNIFDYFYDEYDDNKLARLKALSLEKIYPFLQYFSEKHFKILSDDQVSAFDFSKFNPSKDSKITHQNIFDYFYDKYDNNKLARLKALSLEKIYPFLQYFSEKHFKILSDDQVSEFDFSKFNPSKDSKITHQNIFDYFYDEYDNNKLARLKALSLEKIYTFLQYFSEKHFKILSDDQVSAFDFSKFNPSKDSKITHQNIFDYFYDKYDDNKLARLKTLSLEKIYPFLQYFSEKHFKILSDDQVSAFDFSKFKPSNGSKITHRNIFDYFYDKYYKNKLDLLNKIPLEKITGLTQYFSKEHWEALEDQKIVALKSVIIKENLSNFLTENQQKLINS